MNGDLERMIENARTVKMTLEEMEAQRRSFAFGSANIENSDITRQVIDEAARVLASPSADGR